MSLRQCNFILVFQIFFNSDGILMCDLVTKRYFCKMMKCSSGGITLTSQMMLKNIWKTSKGIKDWWERRLLDLWEIFSLSRCLHFNSTFLSQMLLLIGVGVVILAGMLFQHIYSMTHIYPQSSTKVMNARLNQAELIPKSEISPQDK